MKDRLYWIVMGGFFFWLPAIIISGVVHSKVSTVLLNVLPLAGIAVLGTASWVWTRRFPRWGWVLAGIYIFGPLSMQLPSLIPGMLPLRGVPGETAWMVLFCLFPPMTLWMALLNGMIFSVLIATAMLPFLIGHGSIRAQE